MSTVGVVRCSSYEQKAVSAAVNRGISLLGGIERFVRPGETIVLKPNLLVGRTPERAVTTHPAVFRAAAKLLQAAGARLEYGDSPGFGRTEAAATRAGIAGVARELGIPAGDFATGVTISFPGGRLIRQFTIAQGIAAADGLISLPKMKTHGLTRITGAIKNQFGCVPGMLKAEFHARLPNAGLFSQMLVDLNLLLRPRLFIMDGVVAMEGNGPQGGRPRSMNVLLFSEDPVAMDAAFCHLIRLDPTLVPPIVYGAAAGLGDFHEIDWIGDPVEELVAHDYDVNRSPRSTTDRLGRPSRLARRLVVPKPVIRKDRCTRCGACVNVCPVTPKAVDFPGLRTVPPVHHYDRCIRCYCCQEMCPEGAIEIDVPLLGRILHR
jgi:uncharacterized protein (DUF362 family)/ferredoxin